MIPLNESKIDTWRNSVKCGVCSMWWGLERFTKGDVFVCKRCGTSMCKPSSDPMPIRELSLAVKEIFKK
jgi:uncharacterized paraquat-inducible protein A